MFCIFQHFCNCCNFLDFGIPIADAHSALWTVHIQGIDNKINERYISFLFITFAAVTNDFVAEPVNQNSRMNGMQKMMEKKTIISITNERNNEKKNRFFVVKY